MLDPGAPDIYDCGPGSTAHLDMCAEEKCASGSSQPVSAVLPNSLEHLKILSKFAQTAVVEAVTTFTMWSESVAAKWLTTVYNPCAVWHPSKHIPV